MKTFRFLGLSVCGAVAALLATHPVRAQTPTVIEVTPLGAGAQVKPISPRLAPPAGSPGLRAPAPVLVDRVVAIVNREIITASELVRKERELLLSLKRQGVTPPSPQALREQVLDRMITDRAMLQLAKESGIRVDDATLDRAIGRIAEQNGLTVAALRTQLEAEGIAFAKFRQDIRDEITLTRLREREVDNKLQVTESEVDTFLAAQGQSIQRLEEFKVSQILIRVSENASKADLSAAQDKLKEVRSALSAGQSFADVAKRFSESADREQGGSLGWRPRERLPDLFVNAVSSLKPGQLSADVRSANGLHVLLLEDRRSTLRSQEVAVHRARHILVRVDAQTTEEAARRRIQDLRRRVELGADFAQLARDFSQDPGSATRGGELDWAYPGDLVPEFERAMAQLAPGQLSEPVRSVFGVHLIQLLERKREPLTEQRLRTVARMALRDQKLEQAVADWTREVRANAYVEIKRESD